MKTNLIPALAMLLLASGGAAGKKALDHDAFDSWNIVKNLPVSNSGEWEAFTVNPQEGDGTLTFYNSRTGRRIEIPRGYQATFSNDSRWAVALIKPLFKDSRQAKIDKKKDFDAPQDSLAIIDLRKGTVERIPDVIGYRLGKEGGDWVAYQSCDTTLITPMALKDKKAGRPLVLRHLPSGTKKTIRWSKDYVFSRDGRRLAVTLANNKNDSTATDGLGIVNFPDTTFSLIDREARHYGTPVFDRAGDRLAYTLSNDSADSGTRHTLLFTADLSHGIPQPEEITVIHSTGKAPHLALPHSEDPEVQARLEKEYAETMRREAGEQLVLNQYTVPQFSHDGKRLIAGVAPAVAPNDTTIIDFESPTLDIWRWDAPYTPPQENHEVENLRRHTFPVVIDLETGHQILLTTNPLAIVDAPDRWDADWALLHDPSKNIVSHQWDYYAPEDISIVNVNDGARRAIGSVYKETAELSPEGKFVVWFDDKDYYSYEIATGVTRNLTSGLNVTMWDEKDDHPMVPQPYGMAGWSEGDKAMLVYDRYDIWSLDPTGAKAPVNLTKGEGRRTDRRYRYVKTDPESRFVRPGEEMLLSVFDYADKRKGLAFLRYGAPAVPTLKILDGYSFTQIQKAKDNQTYSFVKSNFSAIPNVFVATKGDFAKAKQVSDANPQQKDYRWGTAQLEKWYAYDGTPSEGVLYVPEDLDPTQKYPMLCVFYETGSEELYTHYTMEPSWSWVNYPFYVSRGYVVFVPDIHYTAGIPGECAYNFVCSGAEEMCRRYPWIDKDRIGIDGQSWGGYQTAYLVTRTDMFACAGSGAPVSNMTSAYGGIRWGTGDSRMAQYEMGQSRIGATLWDAPELYIKNSPVFHADRVHTPLLIMHNDADGAVPWYQGIEYFMALRRLGKPVWMLQYNGEAHNLKERRNRKDITRRLQQFFDHYLKGDPMPEWMREGIPAVRKGQEFGY
ncbi:MAG: prolyl oligopeptidase family serine peptidase [Muribaculaceae bacterium]|nr:prolyl oligopeptidase family serine peptidase [Muribaculaceae bacterium]